MSVLLFVLILSVAIALLKLGFTLAMVNVLWAAVLALSATSGALVAWCLSLKFWR